MCHNKNSSFHIGGISNASSDDTEYFFVGQLGRFDRFDMQHSELGNDKKEGFFFMIFGSNLL